MFHLFHAAARAELISLLLDRKGVTSADVKRPPIDDEELGPKPMVSRGRALKFAREWIEAWNAHDLEAVLSHYTDDFEMSSPFIVAFTGESSGTLRGKTQVSAYWRNALRRIPDLRFELLEVFSCVDSITIYYKAVLGRVATEVLFLNRDGKAYKALAHYDS